jgi:hypothetical protein
MMRNIKTLEATLVKLQEQIDENKKEIASLQQLLSLHSHENSGVVFGQVTSVSSQPINNTQEVCEACYGAGSSVFGHHYLYCETCNGTGFKSNL